MVVRIIIIVALYVLKMLISRRRSLEKNPAKKGTPHRARLAVIKHEQVKGSWVEAPPIWRRSWV